jgi:hypothetical protein
VVPDGVVGENSAQIPSFVGSDFRGTTKKGAPLVAKPSANTQDLMRRLGGNKLSGSAFSQENSPTKQLQSDDIYSFAPAAVHLITPGNPPPTFHEKKLASILFAGFALFGCVIGLALGIVLATTGIFSSLGIALTILACTAAGMTLGGVLGGVCAWLLNSSTPPDALNAPTRVLKSSSNLVPSKKQGQNTTEYYGSLFSAVRPKSQSMVSEPISGSHLPGITVR